MEKQKPMTYARIIILLITAISFLNASNNIIEKYSRIAINIPDRATLDRVWKTGIDLEGSSGKIGGRMEFITGSFELQKLREEGIKYEIIIDDISKISSEGYVAGPANALGFGYGSMGGFYTYSEVGQQLDSMRLLYPNLISQKESIGSSHEGREIWAVKISDNPDIEENEPEVLLTALHHAREPAGMMAVIYYMWWLLENYSLDPDASYLVNNRQMWFIPVVNPDGYVYNEMQYSPPSTFGMWRKNRRVNNDGTRGVDLNRNYGPYDMWDSPNGGSSTYPGSETYRGPYPFSEPEVYAIQGFIWFHNVKICLNYHTYSNLLIYPWGYENAETPDSLIYREFAFYMVGDNRYLSGRDDETVYYGTRGNSDDFMYGDLSKPKVFAMTPEVGTTGFWPTTAEILPLAQENLTMNILASYFAGQYSLLKSYEINDNNGNGFLQSGESFSLLSKIQNKGLGNASNLHVEISANSPIINFSTNQIILSNLSSRAESTLIFAGTVINSLNTSARVDVYFHFSDSLGYSHSDTVALYIGNPTVIFSDSGNTGMSNWSVFGNWNTTSDSHTPPYSFTDSPAGLYSPNWDHTLTLKNNISLFGYDYAVLKFWTKWAIEPTFDFGKIEISTDGGLNWKSQKTNLTHRASGRGKQLTGSWGFDGYTPGLDWVEQVVDLSSYVAKTIKLRFTISSDGGSERDGWYIDDIKIYGYRSSISAVTITDNGANSEAIIFGEDGSATSGIDTHLGEIELDPKPTPGIFDIRWLIPGTNGTKINYLDTLSPANPVNIFTAEFQPGPSGYPIIIKWNPSILRKGGWRILDGLTHGSIFNLNMLFNTSLVINNTDIGSIEIVHKMEDTISTILATGWNLLSLPVITDDRSITTLYPSAVTEAFEYSGSYIPVSSINYHKAYWIKFNNNDTSSHIGIPITSDSLNVAEGWWMISSLGCPVIVEQMICNPSPCKIYVFRGVYTSPSVINPGEGFWIKGPASLSYSCLKPFESRQSPGTLSQPHSMNKITFIDINGNKSTFFFSDNSGLTQNFELPPKPPSGSFDVRFESNTYVENFNQKYPEDRLRILLQPSESPIKMEWDIKDSHQIVYEISQSSENGWRQSLIGRGKIDLPELENESLFLTKRQTDEIPRVFSLGQNYPNPFNPTTLIHFSIPEPSIVSIKVFNTLGQEIAVLVSNEKYPTGNYNITFKNTGISSGVYYYTMNATDFKGNTLFQATNKMIVLQ